MEQYHLHTTEEYLNLESKKRLPQEVKDEIVRVRTEYQHLDWNIYRGLIEQRQLCISRKLKKKRSLWVDENLKIWYFNNYTQIYEWCGFFHSPEFLQERAEKEEAERKEIEDRREKKKQLKAEMHAAKNKKPEVVVKKKRKRIGQ